MILSAGLKIRVSSLLLSSVLLVILFFVQSAAVTVTNGNMAIISIVT